MNVARRRHGRRTTYVTHMRAKLYGKLANINTELPRGKSLDDESLKAISSGEIMTADHKYGQPFEFKPYCTPMFASNHMPHTNDFSEGLTRRARIIRFNNVFTEGSVACDPHLTSKIVEELPGILNMALTAYEKARERGTVIKPASSEREIRAWRMEFDSVSHFIDERCEIGPEYAVPAGDLYRTYESWAIDAGVRAVTKTSFGVRVLENDGVAKGWLRKTRAHRGIRINPERVPNEDFE